MRLDTIKERARLTQRPRYVFRNGTAAIAPPRRRTVRTPRGTSTAIQLAGTNYYAMDGLGSIFSSIGKAVKKIGGAAFKVAKIALPVAGGVILGKAAAPVLGKVIGGVFKKGVKVPSVQVTPNQGTIPLPSGYDMGYPVPPNAPITYSPAPNPVAVGVPYASTQATGADADAQPGMPVAPQAPAWLMPVAIGGAALLAMSAMKGKRA